MKPQEQLLLPATLQANIEIRIYARTNGYLLRWHKDIGARVAKGELLAEIDTPEVDHQLMQARAAREQTAARLQLAQLSAERWQNLRKSDSVSQQEADERNSDYQQAKADLAAADANVRRLEEMEKFKNVFAPFSGVVTERNVDIGALINAGNGGSDKEMFVVAQVDPLRVYVKVPQMYSSLIHVGMPADVELNEFQDSKVTGRVVRTSEASIRRAGTLLTEVDVPNHDGKLLPGAYAQVHFAIHLNSSPLTLPVNALLFRKEGTRAAVVGPDHRVHLKPIKIGRDFGTTVEIEDGISPQDDIVIEPRGLLEEGEQVKVAPTQGGVS